MKKDTFTVIKWHDACSRAQWQTEAEIKEWIDNDKSFETENCGWIVAENEKFIVVCARRSEFDKQYGLCEKLPKKMIDKSYEKNYKTRTKEKV